MACYSSISNSTEVILLVIELFPPPLFFPNLNYIYIGQAYMVKQRQANFILLISKLADTYTFFLPWALIQEPGIHFQKSLWSKAFNLHQVGNNGVNPTVPLNTSAKIFTCASSWGWGLWKSEFSFQMSLHYRTVNQVLLPRGILARKFAGYQPSTASIVPACEEIKVHWALK